MLSGAAAMPPVPLPVHNAGDDAYAAIISELARVEEAARAGGNTLRPGGGAITATGRQLEGFIGHLDMQVSPFESSAQVYRELRGFLKEQAKELVSDARETVKRSVSDVLEQKPGTEPEDQLSPNEDASQDEAAKS